MSFRNDRIMMDGLRAKLAEVTAEHERMREGMQWIAGQPCRYRVSGCAESGDCITEWCLSCYARTTLEGIADLPSEETKRAAGGDKLVADLLARAQKAEEDAERLLEGEKAANAEIGRLKYKIECLEEEHHDLANQAAIKEMSLGADLEQTREALAWAMTSVCEYAQDEGGCDGGWEDDCPNEWGRFCKLARPEVRRG